MTDAQTNSQPDALAREAIANALDHFWNASLAAAHAYSDPTVNAVMDGIVSGVAAVANALRTPALNSAQGSEVDDPVLPSAQVKL